MTIVSNHGVIRIYALRSLIQCPKARKSLQNTPKYCIIPSLHQDTMALARVRLVAEPDSEEGGQDFRETPGPGAGGC
jgi:hypothetical protein